MLKSQQVKPRRRTNTRATKRTRARRPPPVGQFARSLLREWRRLQLPLSNENIVVAVSGGADSVALLLALDELIKANKLKLQIVVAHVDHQLRKVSRDDARWVKDLAEQLGHTVSVSRVTVNRHGQNLEQAARNARYKSLAALAQKRRAELVLTAHTMDDQAETVLLNLLRGSGADGLGGMAAARRLAPDSNLVLARPLVSWARRKETERYCHDRNVDFRHDEMNDDQTFARVRVRGQLLPLMESFNPRITEALARTAHLLREDSDALNSAAQRLLEVSRVEGAGNSSQLRIDLLAAARPPLRRRALRLWLEGCRGNLRRLELVHLHAIEELITTNRGGRTLELPGGMVSLKRGLLMFKQRTSGRGRA